MRVETMDVHFRPITVEDVPALLWLMQVSVAQFHYLATNKIFKLFTEDKNEPDALKNGKEGIVSYCHMISL